MHWSTVAVTSRKGRGPALWEVRRDVTRRAVRHAHLPWAFLAGLAWAVSFLVPYETSFRLCGFLRWTGYPCMFCGLTRSISAVSQGAWAFAFHNAPIAILLYAGMVAFFFWHAAGLVTGTLIRPGYALRRVPMSWLAGALIVLILANWAYRLAMGLS